MTAPEQHPPANERTPRVSIGLPVYNGENYVTEAIKSLLAQTFTDFELIISDNASTDRTEAICRTFALRNPRIRYHRQWENRGGMWNFNEVFRLARDVLQVGGARRHVAPTYLERCVEILDRRPEIVWAYAQSAKIDQCGRPVKEDPEEIFGPSGAIHTSQAGLPRQGHDSPRPHERFRGVLLGSNWAADFVGVIRTEVLRRTRLLPFCYGGEKVLTAELSLHGPSYEVPETLLFTRIHPTASGNDISLSAQLSFNNPQAQARRESTRLKLLAGYVRAVQNAELRLGERVLCWGVIVQVPVPGLQVGPHPPQCPDGPGVGYRKAKPGAAPANRQLAANFVCTGPALRPERPTT